MRVRTPKPVPPLRIGPSSLPARDGPAMSRCTQGTSPTNSWRNRPGGERAAVATAADVLHVGDFGVEQLAVLLWQGQRPHRFTRPLRRGLDAIADRVIIGHQPGDLLAERHHARAGEGREVDDRIGLALGRERQTVGEDQPSLGVGVEDLGGLAVAEREHVPGADRVTARHVLDHRRVGDDLGLHAQLRERRHRRDDRRRAGHVGLHGLHAAAGLEREAARVEHHTLADQRDQPRAPRGAYVILTSRGGCFDP